MTVTVEEQRVRALFEAADKAEGVAHSLPEGDERRSDLLDVSHAVLAEVATVRVVIAARILGLSEKTIRTWADQGVLTVAEREPRLLLDAASVHEVSHFIRQLREAGKNRDLLDEIGRRLHDQAVIEDDDFKESLAQMRRGEVEVLRPLPKPDKDRR
jgi:DNA-binding transcriptional MerR regulator